MQVLLMGHKQSKLILSASAYLIAKYIGADFNTTFANFGRNRSDLFGSEYFELGKFRMGGISQWSAECIKVVSQISDEFLIFGLDDYLLNYPIDMNSYSLLLNAMKNDAKIACAKMGFTPGWRKKDVSDFGNGIYSLNENADYLATTQWGIWRKNVLLEVLKSVQTPWQFELEGTKTLRKLSQKIIGTYTPALIYPEASSLSSRHPGKINVLGNSMDDIENLSRLGLVKKTDLILGQWEGKAHDFEIEESKRIDPLKYCPTEERHYYQIYLSHLMSKGLSLYTAK
jgi:hypothetical protein